MTLASTVGVGVSHVNACSDRENTRSQPQRPHRTLLTKGSPHGASAHEGVTSRRRVLLPPDRIGREGEEVPIRVASSSSAPAEVMPQPSTSHAPSSPGDTTSEPTTGEGIEPSGQPTHATDCSRATHEPSARPQTQVARSEQPLDHLRSLGLTAAPSVLPLEVADASSASPQRTRAAARSTESTRPLIF